MYRFSTVLALAVLPLRSGCSLTGMSTAHLREEALSLACARYETRYLTGAA